MFMRLWPIICIFFYVLIAQTYAEASTYGDLYNIMLNPPRYVLQDNSGDSDEKIVRGCISYTSEYNGLLSANGWACMGRNSKGRIIRTNEFSFLFTNRSGMVELGTMLIADNAEIAPNYWELRVDRLCLIKEGSIETTCLLANHEEDSQLEPLQPLKSNIKDYLSSHSLVGDTLFVMAVSLIAVYALACCCLCDDLSRRREYRYN